MAIGRESSTGGQDKDEKKDHHEKHPPYRERGGEENRFEDPQDLQARGKRPAHSLPGGKGGKASRSESSNPPPTDNTVPGGNRPKRSRQGRQDHN